MTIIVVGIVMLTLGVWGIVAYWWSLLEILRGLIPFLLVLMGLIAIGAGVRNNVKEGKPKSIKD